MRWPIRYQILLPFAAVVFLAVAGLTIVVAAIAARASERQTLQHLQNTVETLTSTNVPYTAAVLQKIRGFSGAHLIGRDPAGKVVVSTLPDGTAFPVDSSDVPDRVDLSPLTGQPVIEVAGERYYVVRFHPRSSDSVQALDVLYPVGRWNRAQRDAALLPIMVGGPALLLTSAVALWLSQRFSRRLRLLQEQVAAIAAGDFREIAPGPRNDELQDLTLSVNRMAARLREMQQAIRHSERTELLAQVAGGLAHQLRNAVAGARLALQLHQRRCAAAATDRSLDVALRQLSLTETQLRGLLSLGRAEHRPPERCEVAHLIGEVEALLEPSCDHSGVDLQVERVPAGAVVLVEVEGLRGAVLNLALNAIEAAGSGGRVAIEVRADGTQVSIEIRDTGAGPPGALSDCLFDPFVTGKPEGVGLGLALARQVAVDHGGSLDWSRQDAETVFRLVLPVYAASISELTAPVEFRHIVHTSSLP